MYPTVRRMLKERESTAHECEEAGRLWLGDRARRNDTSPMREQNFLEFCRGVGGA